MPSDNIYLSRNFIETQRKKGISDSVIADFIGKNIPEVASEVQTVKQKYGSDKAMASYLDWKVYGTSNPTERFVPEEPQQPEQKGFLGKVAEEAFTGPRGVFGSIAEIGKGIKQDIGEAGMKAREKTMKIGQDRNVAQGFVPVMGEIAYGATKALNEPVKPLEKTLFSGPVLQAALSTFQKNPQILGPIAGPLIKAMTENPEIMKPIIQGMLDNAETSSDFISKIRQEHPIIADNIEGALKTVSLPLAMQGAESTLNTGEKVITGIGKKSLDIGANALEKTKGAAANMGEALSERSQRMSMDKIQESVQPEANAKVVQDTRAKNPDLVQEQTFFKKGKILPTQSEKELAKTASNIEGYAKAKTSVQRGKVVHKALVDKSETLRAQFRANNAALPHQEINARVSQGLADAAKDFPGEEKVFERMGEIQKQLLSSKPGNLEGAWDGRIALYSEAEKRFGPTIFEKGSAKATALRVAAQSMNEAIETGARRAGMSFLPEMKEISSMYDILENLSTQGGKSVLNSGLYKLIKNPYVRAGAAVLGAEEVIRRGGPLLIPS